MIRLEQLTLLRAHRAHGVRGAVPQNAMPVHVEIPPVPYQRTPADARDHFALTPRPNVLIARGSSATLRGLSRGRFPAQAPRLSTRSIAASITRASMIS